MKKYFFLIILNLSITLLNAQKYDNTWILGGFNEFMGAGGILGCSIFDISSQAIVADSLPIDAGVSNVCMSDKQGNLLFYSNGFKVANRFHEIMPHGDSLNYGAVYQDYRGLPAFFGAMCLPHPTDSTLYYLFTTKMEYPFFGAGAIVTELNYYIIDMKLEGGKGDVVEGEILVQDTALTQGCLNAVKHANGRDWWLVMPQRHTNLYYRFLFSPTGISGPYLQNIGVAAGYYDYSGNALFSQDGTRYARFDRDNQLYLFDFDRCTGLLSHQQNINFPMDVNNNVSGLSFSPNGRFLYLSTYLTITQFDLNSSNIWTDRDTVAIYDGFTIGAAASSFMFSKLASNNKIYLSSANGIQYLHVIDKPDEKGIACGVIQHGILLPTTNLPGVVPHFPNYRLGALAGSACDTLKTEINLAQSLLSLHIYPNPTRDKVYLSGIETNEQLTCLLFNAMGQEVRRYVLIKPKENIEISLANLPKGVYYCRVLRGEKVYYANKILKE